MLTTKPVFRFHISHLAMIASLAAAPAFAAPADNLPGAGQLLNQQQQLRQQLPQRLPQGEGEAQAPAVSPQAGPQVLVQDFHFTGADGLAGDADLQAVVASSVGQKLNFAQLQAVAARVTDYLKQKGWPLAHAYLPKQDVTDGHIEIAILQGHVESKGATIVAHDDVRLSPDIIKGTVDGALPGGAQSPSQEDLERGVLLLNDMPGMSAHSTLERGSEPESTRVVVDTSEGPWVSGSLSADNYGNRYTGAPQLNPEASLNDPLGIGDQLTAGGTASTTGGLELFQAGYSLPIGVDGLRFAASYDHLKYTLDPSMAGTDANGTAQTIDAKLTYPLIRTRATSVWGGVEYSYKTLMDNVAGTTISNRTIHDGSVNITATDNDDFGGGGMNTLLLSATTGNLDRGAVASDLQTDSTTAHSNGRFEKATGSVARLQHLTDDFSFFGAVRGQLADKNLDSSEKFILGGPTGVRAYPIGEGTGDEGWVSNLEVRYDVPQELPIGKLQLIAFGDAGGVWLNHDAWSGAVDTATDKNTYMLAGAGIGANLTMADAYTVRASWAIAIGDNPGRSTTGENSDGLNRGNAFWLQAAAQF
ncbi:MAG: ShlB/FhaC/HecB family hemolysin secretion/activation protein [Alphaproteobacteria bacterium]|nr:ShlB/FhaC/HecB family hemolysin secretion/activation protein [Alphaproteobacteria bacterium]